MDNPSQNKKPREEPETMSCSFQRLQKKIENTQTKSCKFKGICQFFYTENYTCMYEGGNYCGAYRKLSKEQSPEMPDANISRNDISREGSRPTSGGSLDSSVLHCHLDGAPCNIEDEPKTRACHGIKECHWI
jgi:hypothetical protein